jgi:hypothetical protein
MILVLVGLLSTNVPPSNSYLLKLITVLIFTISNYLNIFLIIITQCIEIVVDEYCSEDTGLIIAYISAKDGFPKGFMNLMFKRFN